MKHIYDFSLEVPAPKMAMDRLNEVINRHAQRVWSTEALLLPTSDDETEIMTAIFGIGRVVKVNVRIAWEIFASQEDLDEEASPRNYIKVIKLIDKYLQNDAVHWLF